VGPPVRWSSLPDGLAAAVEPGLAAAFPCEARCGLRFKGRPPRRLLGRLRRRGLRARRLLVRPPRLVRVAVQELLQAVAFQRLDFEQCVGQLVEQRAVLAEDVARPLLCLSEPPPPPAVAPPR